MDGKKRFSSASDDGKRKKKARKPALIIPVVAKVESDSRRRELINGFHNNVKKAELAAEQQGANAAKVVDAHADMQQLGGLQRYQEASLLGQSSGYRYNTAKWVVKMLKTYNVRPPAGEKRKLTLLDVGSLCNNYSEVPWLEVLAIDLNPCHPSVKKQDFFELNTEEQFDIVVLSLVVNFVGTPARRGEMLRRSVELIHEGGHLFLVLPKACVANSRNMDDELLIKILTAINLGLTWTKHSTKLAFYILKRLPGAVPSPRFEKCNRHSGSTRNGFSITME